jgi:hypothetical protein
MNEKELVRAFVDWCEYRHLDPAETLRVLNAQDWHQEYVTIPAFTFSDDV